METNKLEIEKALHQISEIHGHLTRNEIYRGYRSLSIALAGFLALLAGGLQGVAFPPETPVDFVHYWVLVAAVCAAVSSSEIVYNYVFREDSQARRKTRRFVGQFVPCLLASAGATFAICRHGDGLAAIPALWAMFLSLGLFSSRPLLPRATGIVALYYLIVGVYLLSVSLGEEMPSTWAMALTFGVGQLFSALIVYWNIERKDEPV